MTVRGRATTQRSSILGGLWWVLKQESRWTQFLAAELMAKRDLNPPNRLFSVEEILDCAGTVLPLYLLVEVVGEETRPKKSS